MPDNSYNCQVLYNSSAGTKPIEIGEGDDKQKVVGFGDFTSAINQSEAALGQKITQDNAWKNYVSNLVTDAGLIELDTGTATTQQLAEEVNKMKSILTQLIITGKQ